MQKKSTKLVSNKPFDFILCAIVFILLALGIVMVLSASAPSALAETGKTYTYAVKQLRAATIGIICMFFLSRVNYKNYKKIYWPIYWISIALLASVLIPGLGVSANGAKRWVQIPILGQFQPSELAKIGLIIFYAGYLSDRKDKIKTVKQFITSFILLALPIGILFIFQNHLSASLIIAVITCVMMIVSGAKMLHFVVSGCLAIGAVAPIIVYKVASGSSDSFRIGRLVSFLDPWQDAQGTGWQVIQSLYAIGSGGLFGAGLGESKQKYLYISEPQNDFIFSIIAEELGFVGCMIIIILFGLLIWRGILVAIKAPDTFGSLIAIGIVSLVAIQVILNIAVVTSSVPNTGIPLPFFSYGGTALLILLSSMRNIA